jgi:methionyl-tRNA synthetase
MSRRLFVTTALPYANGPFHIGHIMEYIQADIWVRFQRMQGHEVHFICADDAHGAPIMIAAEKAGKTPQQFVADIAAGRKPYLDGFHIGFDNWHSTDGPENHQLAQDIYRALKANDLIETRTIEQFFDPEKNMFLPDRFIKGECPAPRQDQHGDMRGLAARGGRLPTSTVFDIVAAPELAAKHSCQAARGVEFLQGGPRTAASSPRWRRRP